MALTATLIGSSNTTLFTSVATSPVLGNAITSIILCNTSSSLTITVTLYAVPNNSGSVGTPSATNMIVNTLSIPPTETVSLDQEKLVLSNNDTLVGIASTASSISAVISTLAV
jgi:hypothetical protein